MITVGIVELVLVGAGMLGVLIVTIVKASTKTASVIAADLREFHVRFEVQDKQMVEFKTSLAELRKETVKKSEIESITEAYRAALQDVVASVDRRLSHLTAIAEGK